MRKVAMVYMYWLHMKFLKKIYFTEKYYFKIMCYNSFRISDISEVSVRKSKRIILATQGFYLSKKISRVCLSICVCVKYHNFL